MLVKRSDSRPIPELTRERQSWLENLRAGDLVHYCNGGYWDLYPILLVVEVNSTTIFTRSIEDLIWKKSVSAMKRAISLQKDIGLTWDKEAGTGLCKWRTHNFILPIEASSMSRWVQKDKEGAIPEHYSPPNLNSFDALRFWLRQSQG